MTGHTLVDKIWDEHVITQVDEGLDLLHVDRHYVHDVTSPKAFSALRDRGVDVFGNCFQNGVLPIVLDHERLVRLANEAASGDPVEVDLRTTTITTPSRKSITFEVNPTRRRQLLEGLDDLDVGLSRRAQIRAFQDSDRERRPWVYFSQR
jgi:hypothetical protein